MIEGKLSDSLSGLVVSYSLASAFLPIPICLVSRSTKFSKVAGIQATFPSYTALPVLRIVSLPAATRPPDSGITGGMRGARHKRVHRQFG